MEKSYKFGCIDETCFTLRSPRNIDGDECDTLEEAFKEACELIEGGAEKVAIVKCRYSEKLQAWVELVPHRGVISVDASDVEDLLEE